MSSSKRMENAHHAHKWTELFSYAGMTRWQRILVMLMFVYCFLTFYYNDMSITSQYGVIFLDSVTDGRPLSFYENCVEANVTPEGAVYDIGIYVLFGIWSIPVWIFRNLAGISVESIGAILWYKLLVLLFLGADTSCLVEIARRIGFGPGERAVCAVLFWLNPMCFFPVFVAVQYDVVIMFFMLKGILAYMDGYYGKFLLWMAVSLTMKPFPVFVLVLLVVMYRKNVFHILLDTFIGAFLMILCKVVYSFNQSYQDTNGLFLSGKVQRLFTIQVADGMIIPVFVIAAGLIYLYVWLHVDICPGQGKDGEIIRVQSGEKAMDKALSRQALTREQITSNRSVIYWIAAIWACFVALADIFPYWAAYYAPFAVLILFYDGSGADTEGAQKEKFSIGSIPFARRKIRGTGKEAENKEAKAQMTLTGSRTTRRLWISFTGNLCLLGVFVYKYYWVYGGSTTYASLLLKKVYTALDMADKNTTVGGGLGRLGLGYLQIPLYLLFILAQAYILISVWKESHAGEGSVPGQDTSDTSILPLARKQYTAHIIVILAWILLTLAALFLPR